MPTAPNVTDTETRAIVMRTSLIWFVARGELVKFAFYTRDGSHYYLSPGGSESRPFMSAPTCAGAALDFAMDFARKQVGA